MKNDNLIFLKPDFNSKGLIILNYLDKSMECQTQLHK